MSCNHLSDCQRCGNYAEELEAKLAAAEEELTRFRNGYKGACYACETVGEKNVELETKLAAAEADAARYRWLLDDALWGPKFGDGFALVVPDDMTLGAIDAAIDAAIQKEQP